MGGYKWADTILRFVQYSTQEVLFISLSRKSIHLHVVTVSLVKFQESLLFSANLVVCWNACACGMHAHVWLPVVNPIVPEVLQGFLWVLYLTNAASQQVFH